MKYHISICDDNAAEAAGIKTMVNTWALDNRHTVEIDVFSSAEQFLFHYAEQKEYDILLYLVNNRGIVLTRDKILNAVWGYDYFGEDRTVDWQIKHPDEHSNKYFYASIEKS